MGRRKAKEDMELASLSLGKEGLGGCVSLPGHPPAASWVAVALVPGVPSGRRSA
ncbi:MAG: hypothetical protein WC655_02295 [Candidatus Hydrogenedentales bacterium]